MKTLTLRVDDDVYSLFKTASAAERRTISNFIEYAALAHLTEESFVDEKEMAAILRNRHLLSALKHGEAEIRKGRYRIVS